LAIGQQLTIEARHVVPRAVTSGVVVVNVPQRMVFVGGPEGTRGWPVAVGRRSWPTPLGAFTVMTRERHPTWDVPASIMEEARRAGRTLPPSVPPGPDNPLGDYWLGLSIGGVGIHGTNAPSSIYQAVTHGCIRMQPDDIAELFAAVAVGTRGTVIYEPILVAMDGEDLVLEVHPDVYRRGPVNGEAYVREQVAGLAPGAEVDWARVASVLAEKAGVPRAISSRANGRARPE
jgi:L,D-transpeptidase ErfK/SrfK